MATRMSRLTLENSICSLSTNRLACNAASVPVPATTSDADMSNAPTMLRERIAKAEATPKATGTSSQKTADHGLGSLEHEQPSRRPALQDGMLGNGCTSTPGQNIAASILACRGLNTIAATSATPTNATTMSSRRFEDMRDSLRPNV